MRVFVTVAAAALLAGCATTQSADPEAQRDPLEGFNRAAWGFNDAIDTVALKPASVVYRTVTPRAARRGILNLFDNLTEPWSFINNLLQGKPDRAMNSLGRFVINTTIGVGGLADHASDLGLRPTREDFGQTLAVWGVKDSAYLVLPLVGPSTVRDGVGVGVNFLADPVDMCLRRCTDLTFWERQIPRAVNLASQRAYLTDSGADTLLKTSLDPYAAARSAFFQRRAAEIADQEESMEGGSDADVDAAIKDLEAEVPVETPDDAVQPPEAASPETPTPQPETQPEPQPDGAETAQPETAPK
ncbi:hypothetical protein ACFB49_09610 [Sphingomonas sp. DBB INV C78]|uniref:MlaA family lipoprotein n=1 Tax=Sphingomonas sp. DBB INV C78 TaxID=3349434 RepID=UPI0036D2E789